MEEFTIPVVETGEPIDTENPPHANKCCEVCAGKIDEIHSVMKELKGLEKTVLPILAGMEKNPMLGMFFKGPKK